MKSCKYKKYFYLNIDLFKNSMGTYQLGFRSSCVWIYMIFCFLIKRICCLVSDLSAMKFCTRQYWSNLLIGQVPLWICRRKTVMGEQILSFVRVCDLFGGAGGMAASSSSRSRKEGLGWEKTAGCVAHLRRWSPAGWGPIACRCSGGSTWACGRSSCRSCARARRAAVRSSPPPTPFLRATVHARFSPWTRTRHRHITGLCDLETVRVHFAAFRYLWEPELHA